VIREELALYGRMAVHLRPSQVAHRARLRTQRAALRRWPTVGTRLLASAAASTAPGWPASFIPVDARIPQNWPSLAGLSTGRILVLGKARELGDPPDWEQTGMPLLWRFHLHYWDWAWGLAASSDRPAARAVFSRLWRSWQDSCPFGRGDAWLPYPAALRAWSWCGLYRDLVAGSDIEPEFVSALLAHAAFLRSHLESDVGGNHLIKDLKALAGLGVFLAREQLLQRALRLLRRQLATQVLPDGGHYERAPAYHCQVLADLMDLSRLLRTAGRPPPPELSQAVPQMRRWLGTVLCPDGTVPLLNDGYPVSDALVTALKPGPPPTAPLLLMPDTGIVRAVAGGWHLIADVGAPCPDELPGHAHADTLGCLVYVDGQPLLVDTGTSTYAAGDVRSYERSTAAHNTAEIDGVDSTEMWGAFRVGRRARVRDQVTGIDGHGHLVAEAAHNGYQRLAGRPLHRRRWSLSTAGLRVDDKVTGREQHKVIVRWHLAPGSTIRLRPGGAVVTTPAGDFPVDISASGPSRLDVEFRSVATGFEATAIAPVLTCRMQTVLPARVTTHWRRDVAC